MNKKTLLLLGLFGLLTLLTFAFYALMGGNLEHFSDLNKWLYALIAAIGPVVFPYFVIKIVKRKK